MTLATLSGDRLLGAVDLALMRQAHVVCIGVGGATGLCVDLVRSGLGRLTVIDFDAVDASNLSTQGYDQADIGQPKTVALARRLRAINPALELTACEDDFLALDEAAVRALATTADLLLLMTDNFYAQARGNRTALKYRRPALFAMMYEQARAAEITFVIPGVTPACHRCATSPRYAAYAEGYENDVSSRGSTVFATHYLNSALGFLALAILHHDALGTAFSGWFGATWERNLVQLRLSPYYGRTPGSLFQRTLGQEPRTFTFDALWQRIEPERPPQYPPCPDCGGGGDLRRARIDATWLPGTPRPAAQPVA